MVSGCALISNCKRLMDIGRIILRKYCFEDLYDKEQAQFIIEKELPYQISEFVRSYSEAADNAWQQMYVAT